MAGLFDRFMKTTKEERTKLREEKKQKNAARRAEREKNRWEMKAPVIAARNEKRREKAALRAEAEERKWAEKAPKFAIRDEKRRKRVIPRLEKKNAARLEKEQNKLKKYEDKLALILEKTDALNLRLESLSETPTEFEKGSNLQDEKLREHIFKLEKKAHKNRVAIEKLSTQITAGDEKFRSKKAWTTLSTRERDTKAKSYFRRYWQLYAMLLIPVIYLIVFKYTPMVNVITAFKDYKLNRSVFKMPWATSRTGELDLFKYFKQAFKNIDFWRALRNNVGLHMLDLFFGFPAPIIFALILNELTQKHFKKTVQTIAYMPHFLSWIIIYSLALQLFATEGGMVNQIIAKFGGEKIPFLSKESLWVAVYIFFGVWQSFGWGSIIYLAAIAGINPELYEAASVDGAGRFRKMWNITLPGIKSTIVVLLIMNVGGIVGGNFDRPYSMQNPNVLNVAETIATFVYKYAMRQQKWSLSTAVGLFQSVVGLVFLLGSDWLSRKLGERGIW